MCTRARDHYEHYRYRHGDFDHDRDLATTATATATAIMSVHRGVLRSTTNTVWIQPQRLRADATAPPAQRCICARCILCGIGRSLVHLCLSLVGMAPCSRSGAWIPMHNMITPLVRGSNHLLITLHVTLSSGCSTIASRGRTTKEARRLTSQYIKIRPRPGFAWSTLKR